MKNYQLIISDMFGIKIIKNTIKEISLAELEEFGISLIEKLKKENKPNYHFHLGKLKTVKNQGFICYYHTVFMEHKWKTSYGSVRLRVYALD